MLAGMLISAVSCAKEDTDDVYLSFTDALGREVKLEKKPERVAALIGSFADMWMLSGGTLVAAAEDAFEDFGIEKGNAVSIGGAHSPSLELLLSADPDFVLASASTESNIALEDALTSAGIVVAYFDVDGFEEYLSALRIMTDITGKKDLYKLNGTDIAREIEIVKTEFAASGISDTERRILLLRASSGSVKAKGSEGTVLGEMLADMGFVNIADSDTSLLENLSVEAVIKNEPYRIFAVTMGNNTDAAKASIEAMITENSAWNGLAAVREGRVHIMDKTLFNLKPNERWAEAYRTLYETVCEE